MYSVIISQFHTYCSQLALGIIESGGYETEQLAQIAASRIVKTLGNCQAVVVQKGENLK